MLSHGLGPQPAGCLSDPGFEDIALGNMAERSPNKRVGREPWPGCQEAQKLLFAPEHADYLLWSGWELVLLFPQ